ncbi:AI-2E family transporter [Exilibacterium tricleocarpae]|uniref:AI-2E family transporter n=1 Tax=Exilibacterium tricleocarpae TaxID=2591008 RepID=A0A545SXJ1_9GAMM|nr:AI-2E family transporter [Exilibacterium tricleocarpae]TQV69682.1 AI-2E family transporter [Exilibacterium tricleocarpae]
MSRPITESAGSHIDNPAPAATTLAAKPDELAYNRQARSRKLEKSKVILLATLTILAVGLFIHQAQEILIPITLACLLSSLLSPIVRWAKRYHVPQALTSAIVVMILMTSFVLAINLIAEPAARWVNQLPDQLRLVHKKLYAVKGSLSDLQAVGDEVSQLADAQFPLPEGTAPIVVEIEETSWMESLITDDLPVFSGSLVICVVLTFFLLASGDHFLRQVTKLGTNWSNKRMLVRLSKSMRQELSVYLGTISIINACLSIVVGFALYLLDIPNPFFWGVIAGLLNFAPYIGPMVVTVLLALVGLITFDNLGTAMLAPAVFVVITLLEGQVITPAVVGHRLSLTPTAVFIAVVFWTWLWGIAGTLLATPILTVVKILCENVPALRGFNYLIERSS